MKWLWICLASQWVVTRISEPGQARAAKSMASSCACLGVMFSVGLKDCTYW